MSDATDLLFIWMFSAFITGIVFSIFIIGVFYWNSLIIQKRHNRNLSMMCEDCKQKYKWWIKYKN